MAASAVSPGCGSPACGAIVEESRLVEVQPHTEFGHVVEDELVHIEDASREAVASVLLNVILERLNEHKK